MRRSKEGRSSSVTTWRKGVPGRGKGKGLCEKTQQHKEQGRGCLVVLERGTESGDPVVHRKGLGIYSEWERRLVSVRALQGNRTNRACVYKEVYFKELVHGITGAGKSEMHRTDWKTRHSDQKTGADAAVWGRISSSSPETSVFVPKAFNRLDEFHPHYQGLSP